MPDDAADLDVLRARIRGLESQLTTAAAIGSEAMKRLSFSRQWNVAYEERSRNGSHPEKAVTLERLSREEEEALTDFYMVSRQLAQARRELDAQFTSSL